MPRFIAIFSSEPARLLARAYTLSPRIEFCPPNGLLLEVAPRSERQVLKQLLQQSPTTGRLGTGVASTRITALFAAKARPGTVVSPGKESAFLAPLPVGLLSLITPEADAKLQMTFFQWGVRTLGELSALPKGELVARLGQAGLRLQKMARGEDVELFQSYVEEPCFKESQELEWRLDSLESLAFVLGGLLERLCANLQNYGLAADSLHLTLQLDNRTTCNHTLRLAFPMRDPKVLLSLLRLDLQSHSPACRPGSGIVGVSLEATPAPSRVIQHSLLEPPTPNPEKLSRTVGRLTLLLGEKNVGSPILLDTHRPDAVAIEPLRTIRTTAFTNPPSDIRNSTPLSLRRIRPPRPTRIRSDQVVVCAGPWRSSGDWWAGTNQSWSRDEWDVELHDGSICRIYWDYRQKGWFLEGIYD